jgi:hypothetical protein
MDPDFLMKLEEQKKICNIAQPGNYTEYAIQGSEFPEIPRRPSERGPATSKSTATACPGNRSAQTESNTKLRLLRPSFPLDHSKAS